MGPKKPSVSKVSCDEIKQNIIGMQNMPRSKHVNIEYQLRLLWKTKHHFIKGNTDVIRLHCSPKDDTTALELQLSYKADYLKGNTERLDKSLIRVTLFIADMEHPRLPEEGELFTVFPATKTDLYQGFVHQITTDINYIHK